MINIVMTSDKKSLAATVPISKSWIDIPHPIKIEKKLYFRKPKKFDVFDALKEKFEAHGL